VSAPFRRISVVGLGLLGGSVALAARARGIADEVVGAGRSRASVDAALRSGAFSAVEVGPDAVRGAELVVLATPVGAMAGELARAASGLAKGALVTDVGSVKSQLAETLPGLLPPGARYVGAHPMAGSHERGMVHARADLFEGAACAVTPTRDSEPEAVERVCAFWRGLGARVFLRDPARHDAEVAWVSHLPHALAFAFARALAAAPEGSLELAGAGFRDFTRIARSDAELWSEILAANRKALAGPLQRAAAELAELARRLEADDEPGLERFLAEARARLSANPESRPSGGENPELGAARSAAPTERNREHS
jgi:prephenate dehydrogenase